MHIYRADLRDLSACLELEASYETDQVWQVLQQEDENEVVTRFRSAALPRTMYVRYPVWSEALYSNQERGRSDFWSRRFRRMFVGSSMLRRNRTKASLGCTILSYLLSTGAKALDQRSCHEACSMLTKAT